MKRFFSAFLILLLTSVADAQPTTTETASSDDLIVVLLTDSEKWMDTEDAERIVRNRLSSMPVRVEVRHEPAKRAQAISAEPGVLTVIWLDRERPSQIFFTTSRQDGLDVYQRSLPETAVDSLRIEGAAMICRATVQALLDTWKLAQELNESEKSLVPSAAQTLPSAEDVPSDKKKIVRTPDAKANPVDTSADTPAMNGEAPPREAEVENHRPSILGLNAAYAYRALNANYGAVNGFAIGLQARIGSIFRVFASYEFRQEIRAAGACVDVRLRGHPAMIGTEAAAGFGRFSLGGRAAVLLEWVTRETTLTGRCDNTVLYGEQAGRFDVAVSLGVVGKIRLVERLSFYTAVNADIFVMQADLRAPADAEAKELVFEPWRVQPALTVGLSVEVL